VSRYTIAGLHVTRAGRAVAITRTASAPRSSLVDINQAARDPTNQAARQQLETLTSDWFFRYNIAWNQALRGLRDPFSTVPATSEVRLWHAGITEEAPSPSSRRGASSRRADETAATKRRRVANAGSSEENHSLNSFPCSPLVLPRDGVIGGRRFGSYHQSRRSGVDTSYALSVSKVGRGATMHLIGR